ncbi:MAG: thioredoxin domain-containing protein [Verrucomicrobiota bacterium]
MSELGTEGKKANALATEKSPYLLQHAHNPVEWMPWGEEAFRRAREEGKLIFLSIGYSTCHWCHVMERESFENDAIAAIMNEHFINVKVDREERPDVDMIYMAFVQASTRQGGWPLNVWLTPELNPIVGGTYFPPEDRSGRPGFPSVLERLAGLWKDERDQLETQSVNVLGAMREEFSGRKTGADAIPETGAVLALAARQFGEAYDEKHGGFSVSPKFPRPAGLDLLWRIGAGGAEGASEAEAMVRLTLDEMARGGIYDHLGGGFHRYSVDRYWHVPHFEKMLYDQGQLVVTYLDGWQRSGDVGMRAVVEDVLAYVMRDMTAPEGGFYSAEDADSLVEGDGEEEAEGAFYVWGCGELQELLGGEEDDRFRVFALSYGLTEAGNVRPGSDPMGEFGGKNVLFRALRTGEVAAGLELDGERVTGLLEEGKEVALSERGKRVRPHLDDKVIVAWNGLMISGFAKAHQVTGETIYLEAATRAAAFVRERLWDEAEGTLIRSFREGPSEAPGFASDYAFFIRGLLDLYEAGFQLEWLRWAVELQAAMDERYFDDEEGGYFSVRQDENHQIVSMKERHDGAEPSPGAVAVSNLIRLARMTGDESLRGKAELTLRSFAKELEHRPIECPQMALALDDWSGGWAEVVVVDDAASEAGGQERQEMLRALHGRYLPRKTVMVIDSAEAREFFSHASGAIGEMKAIDGKPTAYVCRDFACQQPVTDVAGLEALLSSL